MCWPFIQSGYFYSASSSPLLLRGAPDTARILCRSFTLKRHRQLRVKTLPKVPTWRLKWDFEPTTLSDKINSHICSMSSVYESFHQAVIYGGKRNNILQDLTEFEI